jgi:hypothetical protein
MRLPLWLDPGGPPHGERVTITVDVDAAVTVLAPTGRWSRPLHRAAGSAVRKCLGEQPAALVLDLNDLEDRAAGSVATWLHAGRAGAALQPAVRVVACMPAEAPLAVRLARTRSARFLPRYDSVTEARAALAGGELRVDRMQLRLEPDALSPALARNLVTDACAAWRLPGVLHPARLVMSELARNAVVHARTPYHVVVARRPDGLHLIVSDRSPHRPERLAPEPADHRWRPRGQGLRIVEAAATAWGWLPTAEGKMVWANLREGHPAPPRGALSPP